MADRNVCRWQGGNGLAPMPLSCCSICTKQRGRQMGSMAGGRVLQADRHWKTDSDELKCYIVWQCLFINVYKISPESMCLMGVPPIYFLYTCYCRIYGVMSRFVDLKQRQYTGSVASYCRSFHAFRSSPNLSIVCQIFITKCYSNDNLTTAMSYTW